MHWTLIGYRRSPSPIDTNTPQALIMKSLARNNSRGHRIAWLVWAISTVFFLGAIRETFAQDASPQSLSDQRRHSFRDALTTLQGELRKLPENTSVDAVIFAKGLQWALDYDQEFTPADEKLLENAIVRCRQRIAALKEGKTPWTSRRGKIALGYVSKVDGSVQPYGVIVPKNYDPEKRTRLDIVLHGSMRPVGMSELRFLSRFDEGDEENASPPDQPFIELHPLGRVENCYRWAGETDVFEAISDVCRRFNIDTNRQVLRGMSMGASGTWHLGLKHPDRFVALGPYCGYVDTHKFSETPLPNFVKVGPLPEHQELGLHMLDSVDYAANASVVPVVAAMGEKDIFFDAHVIMGAAMKQEGLDLVNLISPGTGHVIDPVTHAEQMRRIGEYAEKGLNHSPESIRFVTWTLKYPTCHWLTVLGLEKHYERAEISAQMQNDRIEIAEPQNISRFRIDTSLFRQFPAKVRIGSTELKLRQGLGPWVFFERSDEGWRMESFAVSAAVRPPLRKSPSSQGPIDDAFTKRFVCVRGTGTPWNPAAHAYAEASLSRFADEWRRYFRGDLPVKDDVDVTDDDFDECNMILFGDPGSNSWMAKLQLDFPIHWSKQSVQVGNEAYASDRHLPAFIMPTTSPPLQRRYIVINSGHTFRGADLGKVNYLLFPRWGDWAVLKIDPDRAATEPLTEEVVKAGYFDEQWKLPR